MIAKLSAVAGKGSWGIHTDLRPRVRVASISTEIDNQAELAALFAAAPELLGALVAVLAIKPERRDLWEPAALAAIAKARRSSPAIAKARRES